VLLWVILGCEVAFWVLLAAGLGARYFLKARRLSTVLLVSVPLIDVALLIFSVVDMRNGATASFRHGLAAAYIAYSVMFGHRTIRWADQRFAHRFAGGPPPWKPPKVGQPRVRYELVLMAKIVAAYAIAWAVTGVLILAVSDADRTAALIPFMVDLVRIVAIAGIISAFDIYSALKKARNGEREERQLTGTSAGSSPGAAL
jgi:hypothetical protein